MQTGRRSGIAQVLISVAACATTMMLTIAPSVATTQPPAPTPTPTLCPQATPEPLYVDPVFSPTDELTQMIAVTAGNAERVEVISEAGTFVAVGPFSSSSPAWVTVTLL